MSLTEVIKKMEEKAGQQRKLERERLEEIAAVTSLQFAEQAAGALDSRIHAYSYNTYLVLLRNLIDLLQTGMSEAVALETVQATGIRTDIFLKLQGGEKFDKEEFKRIPGTEKKTREVKE